MILVVVCLVLLGSAHNDGIHTSHAHERARYDRAGAAALEVRVLGAEPCTRVPCAAGGVLRALAHDPTSWPSPHEIPGLGGLHECPCVPRSVRGGFEADVVADVARRWEASARRQPQRPARASSDGLTYLSLGSGGLFPDLSVLAGLLDASVPVAQVVLVDSIFEELLQFVPARADLPRRSPNSALVFDTGSSGLLRLSVPWRRCPPLTPFQSSAQSQAPVGQALASTSWCRQCVAAASLVPLPPANELGVIDLVAHFCGWLSLLAELHHVECPSVVVFGHLSDHLTDIALQEGTGVLPADVAVFSDLHWDLEMEKAARVCHSRLLAELALVYVLPSGPQIERGLAPALFHATKCMTAENEGRQLDGGTSRLLPAEWGVGRDLAHHQLHSRVHEGSWPI